MLPHLDSSVHLSLPVLGKRGNKLQLSGGSLELKASTVSAVLTPIHLHLKSLHFISTLNDDSSLLVYTTGLTSCPWTRSHHPLRHSKHLGSSLLHLCAFLAPAFAVSYQSCFQMLPGEIKEAAGAHVSGNVKGMHVPWCIFI